MAVVWLLDFEPAGRVWVEPLCWQSHVKLSRTEMAAVTMGGDFLTEV